MDVLVATTTCDLCCDEIESEEYYLVSGRELDFRMVICLVCAEDHLTRFRQDALKRLHDLMGYSLN